MAFHDLIEIELSGGCQCGAVRYHATARNDNAHICHCRMCQKAVGGFFAPLVAFPLDRFAWTRGQPAYFRSSAEVRRGFCSNCGTPLSFESDGAKHLNVTIGSLDHPEFVPPIDQDGMEGQLPYFDALHELPDTGTTEGQDAGWAAGIRASNNQHPDHDTDDWEVRRG